MKRVLFAALLVACDEPAKPPTIPVAPASASASIPVAPTTFAPLPAADDRLAFATLPTKIESQPCQYTVVVAVDAQVKVLGEALAPGDTMVMVSDQNPIVVAGTGTVVIAKKSFVCKDSLAPMKRVARAAAAKELTWANGRMHARLDLVGDDLPIYVGRLSGTAPVAEHVHEKSWEMIATLEGGGTFTSDGVASRLGSHQVVQVPPNTKHSFTPDPEKGFSAIQVYDPPGPEQRFVKLSAP